MKPFASLLCSALCAASVGTIAIVRPAAAAQQIVIRQPARNEPSNVRVVETLRQPESVRVVERTATPNVSNVNVTERIVRPAPSVNVTERIVRPTPQINVTERIVRPAPQITVQENVQDRIVEPFVLNPYPDYAADYLNIPVYETPVIEAPIVQVPLLPSERTVWQTSETFYQGNGWINTTLPVNTTGNRLLLGVNGNSDIQSAIVQFANGQSEQINLGQNFSNQTVTLAGFGSQRQVQSVQIIGRSNSPQSEIRLRLQS